MATAPHTTRATVHTAPTQVRRPWKATVRTVFQALVGFAVLAPSIYEAATHKDPAAATGYAAVALAICAAVTRIMALPQVEAFLARFVPFLAANGATPKRGQGGYADALVLVLVVVVVILVVLLLAPLR